MHDPDTQNSTTQNSVETPNQQPDKERADHSATANPPSPSMGPHAPEQRVNNSRPWHKDRGFVMEILGFVIEVLAFGVLCAYTVFAFLQWQHMRWANTMTREALDGNSSTLQQTLNKMTWQIKETHEIAKQTLAQAEQTTRLTNETHTLATAAIKQAEAATSAANTAKDSLHVSERAYLNLTNPRVDYDTKALISDFVNSGRIPSGESTAIHHVLIFSVANPADVNTSHIVNAYWSRSTTKSVAPGTTLRAASEIPEIDEKRLHSGNQAFIFASLVSYNDGFPDTPVQELRYCVQTDWSEISRTAQLIACDYDSVIGMMIANDRFPSPQRQKH